MVSLTPYKSRLDAALKKAPSITVYDNPREGFINELTSAGFTPPSSFELGKLTRIADPNDKGSKKTGWCVYDEHQYDDYILGVGVYGTWRGEPERVTWTSKSQTTMTPKEREYYTSQIEKSKKERDAEQERVWQETAINAMEEWGRSEKPIDDNPYLIKKGVKAYGNARVSGEVFILPVVRGDKISSLQYIRPDGEKRFKTGGRVKGGYFLIDGTEDTIYICEGYATGATLHDATGATVYIAFDCGNLYDVTGYVVKKHENSTVIIAGDDDFKGNSANAGRIKADQAASAYNLLAVYPIKGYVDFNDLHQAEGINAVKKALFPKIEIHKEKTLPVINGIKEANGVLGDIVRYYNATSGADQPLFAIQTAMATLSVLLGRNFVTNKQNRTSLFFMCLGETGTGKETIKNVPTRILEALGQEELMVGSGYTSGSAVLCTLMYQPKHITIIDEYAKYMQISMHKNANAGLAEANSQLMQAFNEINGVARGKNYSLHGLTKEKRKELIDMRVYNPALTMVTVATPEDLFETMSMTQINDGFLNRFLIVTSDAKRQKYIPKDPVDVPLSIVEWWQEIQTRLGNAPNDYLTRPKEIQIMFTADAWDVQDAFNQECVDYGEELKKTKLDKITMRSNEQAMRLALIVALSRDPWTEVIKKEDMEYAIDWVRYCLKALIARLKMSVYSGEHEKNKLTFLKAIRETGENGLSLKDMSTQKPLSNYRPRDRKEILEELESIGLIAKTVRQTGERGQPPAIYVGVE